VINTSTNTASTPILFGPVAPNLLPGVLSFDGTNLWIGSTGCQVNPQDTVSQPGCLSLYFPAAAAAQTNPVPCVFVGGSESNTPPPCTLLSNQTDDITSMLWLKPFNGRSVMYAIEGGRLAAYSSSSNSLPTELTPLNESDMNLNISGTVGDVKVVK